MGIRLFEFLLAILGVVTIIWMFILIFATFSKSKKYSSFTKWITDETTKSENSANKSTSQDGPAEEVKK